MHRRMRLGLGSMLLLLMFLAGPGTAFAEPPAAVEASEVESFELLDWVWGWIVALAGDAGTSGTGEGLLSGGEGGGFMDPNGTGGNG
jgi:hypothetical protein